MPHRRFRLRCPVFTALLLLGGICLTSPCPAQKSPPTLESVLSSARPASAGVVLIVDADRRRLPKDAVLPPGSASLSQIATAFGGMLRPFGDTVALAPATMIVVGMPPDRPNPWADAPPSDVFKILAGSLNAGQWTALYSEGGLGISDLTTDDQRQMFRALFPEGPFLIHPEGDETPIDTGSRDVADQLPQARLRIGQKVMIGLPHPDKPDDYVISTMMRPANSRPRYFALRGDAHESDRVAGARVRDEMPNRPKKGDLDLDLPALQATVALNDLSTVGDLIARTAKQTGIELYADARLEKKKLTLLGDANAAAAANLLCALAFCVTGTYRRVGPAYVLTDDLVGIGTRRQAWVDFEMEAVGRRGDALMQAGREIARQQPAAKIPAFDQPLALSAAQRDAIQRENARHHRSGAEEMRYEGYFPLAELTPAQQETARRIQDYNSHLQGKRRQPTTLDGNILLMSSVELEMLLPSVDGPISFGVEVGQMLTQHRVLQSTLQTLRRQQAAAAATVATVSPEKARADLRTALQGYAHRAVYAAPRNAEEVHALVASMKTLGLNELFVDVFSHGMAQIPGSPLSTRAAGEADGDILALCLAATKGASIAVYPTLDLLQWGHAAAPDEARDRTIRGQSTPEIARFGYRHSDEGKPGVFERINDPLRPETPVIVAGSSAFVEERLKGLISLVAQHPGIAGIVWRETVPLGYSGAEYLADLREADYGYTDVNRLAFLRAEHADPIDIYAFAPSLMRANTNLPDFDDFRRDQDLLEKWRAFRNQSNIALLQSLAAGLDAKSPILVKSTGSEGYGPYWYATWDDRNTAAPSLKTFRRESELPDEVTRARSQSQGALLEMMISPQEKALDLLYSLQRTPKMKQWDGIVLDTVHLKPFSQSVPDGLVRNPLRSLAPP